MCNAEVDSVKAAVDSQSGRHTATMLLIVAIVSVASVIFILKYVFGSSGPNPFETDTREPLKKMVHDRKEKKKVLKQGDLHLQGRHIYICCLT